jgi:hypothetical protein
MMRATLAASALAVVAGHGTIVSPRSRNSVDYLVGVNAQRCSNITGDDCQNGQASFWYSQVRSSRRATTCAVRAVVW